MVKFFKRHHSVHLVSLTTHWLVSWGYTLNHTYIVLVSIWFGLNQQVLRNIKIYTIKKKLTFITKIQKEQDREAIDNRPYSDLLQQLVRKKLNSIFK